MSRANHALGRCESPNCTACGHLSMSTQEAQELSTGTQFATVAWKSHTHNMQQTILIFRPPRNLFATNSRNWQYIVYDCIATDRTNTNRYPDLAQSDTALYGSVYDCTVLYVVLNLSANVTFLACQAHNLQQQHAAVCKLFVRRTA